MNQPAHALIKVSNHTNVYRGFGITRLPRSKLNPITRYRVAQGDQSYGKFDAQDQAIGFIDRLYRDKERIADKNAGLSGVEYHYSEDEEFIGVSIEFSNPEPVAPIQLPVSSFSRRFP